MIIGKRQESITVDYFQLEKLVQSEYGIRDYSFVADQECGNDSTHEFDLTSVDPEADEYDAEQVAEFRQGKHPAFVTQVLLEDLVRRGLLEAGVYYVSVSW